MFCKNDARNTNLCTELIHRWMRVWWKENREHTLSRAAAQQNNHAKSTTSAHNQGIELNNKKIHILDGYQIRGLGIYVSHMFRIALDHSKEDRGLLLGDHFSKVTLTLRSLVRARLVAYGGGESVPLHQRLVPLNIKKEIENQCFVVPLQGGPAELPTDPGRTTHHGTLRATPGTIQRKYNRSLALFLQFLESSKQVFLTNHVDSFFWVLSSFYPFIHLFSQCIGCNKNLGQKNGRRPNKLCEGNT